MDWIKRVLRTYGRWTPTERGAYQLVHRLRRRIPPERWRGRFETPHGLRLDLDLAVYPDCLMAFGLYETRTRRLLRELIRPGARVVDAGANIGYFTLLAARWDATVEAIEPQPDNRARLTSHLALNGLSDRVTVHAAALGAADAVSPLYAGGANHGMASLFDPGMSRSAPTDTQVCRATTLLGADPPALVKIDIEGAEHLAIEGMADWLSGANPPVIVGEVNPASAAAAGVEPDAWIRRAQSLQPRYQLYEIGLWRRRIDSANNRGQLNVMLRTR